MSRQFIAIATAVSLLSLPAYGADIFGSDSGNNDFLKDSYSDDWDMSDNGDPLDFEYGLRYFYSVGSSKLSVNGDNYSSKDQSHIIELHGRIDDNSTDTYLKGKMGYSVAISGTYETPEFIGEQNMDDGAISYISADFGYLPFGSDEIRLGGFIGYEYLNDSSDKGRSNFLTSSGSGASDASEVIIHQLKLGAAVKAEFGDMVDLNIEGAIIPYASISGAYGAFNLPNFLIGGNTFVQGSGGSLSGNLYGASGEMMLGVHPTDELTIRVGGRVSYLTGNANMTYSARELLVPTNSQGYTADITGFEMFRYGALLELTGRF